MANSDAPRGLRPLYRLGGGNTFNTKNFAKDASAGVLGINDPVRIETDGNISKWVAGAVMVGVCAKYSATATADTVPVYVDPDLVYEIQADSGGTYGQSGIGAACNLVLTAANTTTGLSQVELDASSATPVSSATHPVTVLALRPIRNPDGTSNALGASHAKLEVIINRGLARGLAPSI